jgi:hypothetical protein
VPSVERICIRHDRAHRAETYTCDSDECESGGFNEVAPRVMLCRSSRATRPHRSLQTMLGPAFWFTLPLHQSVAAAPPHLTLG